MQMYDRKTNLSEVNQLHFLLTFYFDCINTRLIFEFSESSSIRLFVANKRYN